MASIPPFLARLSLDHNAGASDIRRAYARELTLIDQEHNAAGFQVLREAYEAALQWAKLPRGVHDTAVQRAVPVLAAVPHASVPAVPQFGVPSVPVVLAKAAPAVMVAPAAAPRDPVFPEKTQTKVDPQALAAQVYTAFTADFAAMMQGAEPDLPSCRSVLERALNQPALLNISARIGFEERLVRLLAAGWKPGHEILLVAATKAFEWSGDRRRLFEFGAAGARLSQAIDERNRFDAQPDSDQLAQGEIVGRLRSDAVPDAAQLVRSIAHLDALETRFPTWLALVTDVSRMHRWRELERQVPAWRRKLMFEKVKVAQPSYEKSSGGGHWGAWVLLMIVINVGRVACNSSSPPPPSPPGYVPIAVEVPSVKLREEEIAAILALVQYQAPPDLREELQVEFEIELDSTWRASRVQVTSPSRDPAYDAAVAAAIRAAPAFSVLQPSRFRWYHVRPRLAY